MNESTHSARNTPAHISAHDRLFWWQQARFGMSLHLGLYTIPARNEWVRSVERMDDATYRAFFDSFNPAPGWAREWAALARAAGARYGILTAKHHDGFCLFNSALTEFKAPNTPAKRDLVREFVEACRAEGLRVGLYYSLPDWHHPDYPAWGDRQHPLRHDPASQERDRKADWGRYVSYMHGQVEELCRNYGVIDLLFFDFSYWDFTAEKWGATELLRKIRALQPDVVINDRLGNEALKQVPVPPWAGDFDQTEQDVPREGLRNAAGQPIPWESWFTLNNSWCYSSNDHEWKDARAVIRALVNCVSKDGGLTLNVSPDATGRMPDEARSILEQTGRWLAVNGESIYGAGAVDLPKPEWGRWTGREGRIYAHILEPFIGHLTLPGLRGKVKNGRLLATGAEAIICDYWNPGVQTFDRPEDIFLNFGTPTQSTFRLPDTIDTVVGLELTSPQEEHRILRRYATELSAKLERTPFG